QWKFFDKKANENKKRYHQLQMIIGVGSGAVPVLVGINSADPVWQQVLYWVTVTISLAVAISAAVENIYKYGDNWRSYRQAAEELQQEKFLYDVKAGRYAGNAAGFARFAERTEEIIAKQNGQFMQTVERQQSQAAEQNAELLSKYQTEGQNRLTDFSSGGTYSSSGGVFVSGGSVMPGGAAPDVPGMTPTLPVSAPAPVLDTSSAG
ncbi:MAG: DUF4231 domain-containing protein, partial [Anaerolineae bacterium]|nr:DUF4231 domain-containing protein [Anaerolineae bacterium]